MVRLFLKIDVQHIWDLSHPSRAPIITYDYKLWKKKTLPMKASQLRYQMGIIFVHIIRYQMLSSMVIAQAFMRNMHTCGLHAAGPFAHWHPRPCRVHLGEPDLGTRKEATNQRPPLLGAHPSVT